MCNKTNENVTLNKLSRKNIKIILLAIQPYIGLNPKEMTSICLERVNIRFHYLRALAEQLNNLYIVM